MLHGFGSISQARAKLIREWTRAVIDEEEEEITKPEEADSDALSKTLEIDSVKLRE